MGGRSDCDFCALCGTMLVYESATTASCALCKAQRNAEVVQEEVWCTINAEDLARRLGIDPLVLPELDLKTVDQTDEGPKKAVVNEDCPKCKNPQLEYYTRQLRSADEGQTVFYECPKCRHKFSQNT
ncbi:DNA-directed RNA polymerase I subunit RPA12 [Selaginella moellendorffii]|uniref:DNA-directed RNA polymerase I subunit RPA12 n=1 Tax=Selaginella moellendorffii TaxID=88036 RepID=UPI000D1C37D5|nr:DNA-directed RNA polymerase I subunit RPA12 [Selaginella moellendorffii]XP_024526637.1 DNA-directed RNA polymerase I subunit RPA12 [Selaginella moellendorffii]XP_024526638.1 DNA-directed RNA polymerase I subunit RPA12 [Selaginella moellendorffii]XP_024545376.1 DNA-directed RNA polymerase I subunit RPA12 [Selaginella moellendorffii]XP_024545377.1 DNA-directed RNA polymerase I subunit RPA12 [Selaginella moellendorffii]XP_024545378.1 DNA-directed RNA polymerase I subunit RPA12 [Selaginella moe|eukprot:XP_024526636.1 DNA-directed RNA polymerase I subunit RPA12 [Selaginella moellendorffii]